MRVRKGLIGFIVIIQSVLFLTHFLLYETWHFLRRKRETAGSPWIKLTLASLSLTFIALRCSPFRYQCLLAGLHRAAAGLVGLLSFLFLAAVFLLDYFRSSRGWLGLNIEHPLIALE